MIRSGVLHILITPGLNASADCFRNSVLSEKVVEPAVNGEIYCFMRPQYCFMRPRYVLTNKSIIDKIIK